MRYSSSNHVFYINILINVYPKRSMYAIYACIGVVGGVNVSIYSIHGVHGYMYFEGGRSTTLYVSFHAASFAPNPFINIYIYI